MLAGVCVHLTFFNVRSLQLEMLFWDNAPMENPLKMPCLRECLWGTYINVFLFKFLNLKNLLLC